MDIYSLREPRDVRNGKGRSVVYEPTSIGMPGVACRDEPGSCGAVWATTIERVRKELPEGHPLRSVDGRPVPPSRLRALSEEFRRALDLPTQSELQPGTDVGLVRVRCRRSDVPSFEWPKPHTLLVTEAAGVYLREKGLTGWHEEPVVITEQPTKGVCPTLFELVVDGRGGMAVTEPEIHVRSTCPVCGRVVYEKPVLDRLEVAPARWDGSDFFRFDPPMDGYIFVTEQVNEALSNSPLKNYELVTVEQLLDARRPENFGR